MKILNNILFFTFAILVCTLFSCEMKKDLFGQPNKPMDGQVPIAEAGLLDLELKPHKEANLPESKGGISGSDVVVIDVNDFTVEILDSLGQVYKHYESYADLKNEGGLLLPAGTYSVRATLGEDVNAGFDSPFYSGSNECKITPQEVAKVITNCVLSNKKIVFRCSEEFNNNFEDDYSIVVDNGCGALTTFKDEKRATYLKNTGVLQFTIYTTTLKGKKDQVYNIDLSNQEEVLEHNNILVDLNIVNEVPGGDDNENPDEEEPDEPDDPGDENRPDQSVKAPTIKVDISLIEKDYVIEIPSNFVDAGGDDPNEPETPSTQKPTVAAILDGKSFDIATPQDVTSSSQVVIQLTAPEGLASLVVTVKIAGLDDPLTIDIFDLDPTIEEVLAGMKLPEKGKTSMQTFNISSFMKMLGSGINTFGVVMTDEKGENGYGTITLNKKE